MLQADPKMSWLEKITSAPREILGLPVPVIEKGSSANLTLFDPTHKWEFNESENKSKSRNSPFLGHSLKGKALGVFNNKKYYLDPVLSEQFLING